MKKRRTLALLCLLLWRVPAAPGGERIIVVRFHGNYSISDDEMARLADVRPGAVLDEASLAEIKNRLVRTRKFEWVEVSKRYRSLSAGDEVVLVITVKEKPPARSKFMFMPILSGSDEYGFTYGGRFTSIDLLGAKERLSLPVTWGGIRRAALEGQRDFHNPVISSVYSGAGVSRKENPHFEIGDLRREGWGGVSRRIRQFQVDLSAGWTGVDFGPLSESFVNFRTDLAFDTRQEINFPRDALYAGIGWERIKLLDGGPRFNRYKLDVRGYKGVFGQAILAGQFLYHIADGRLPDYQRPFLGGSATLRGENPGAFIGDNLVLTSLELRMPLNSKLAVYRAGIDIFLDSGAVYDHGRSLGSADFKHGAGIGFFLFVAGFGIKVDFAHNLRDNFRVHFSTGFRF